MYTTNIWGVVTVFYTSKCRIQELLQRPSIYPFKLYFEFSAVQNMSKPIPNGGEPF